MALGAKLARVLWHPGLLVPQAAHRWQTVHRHQGRGSKTCGSPERFLVPLELIDEAIERIKDGTISDYEYDPSTDLLKPIAKTD
jgi:hypothetical protein